MIRETTLFMNISRSLPTTLAAQVIQAEGRCLLEGQTLNVEKSLTLKAGTQRLAFSKMEGGDRPKQKEVHEGDVSFYIKNVDLTYLRQKYNYKEYKGKT